MTVANHMIREQLEDGWKFESNELEEIHLKNRLALFSIHPNM